jgi:DNA-binding NarL/FixJ family response regulator
MAARCRPDVVLLDVVMPRMGGLEALAPLRSAVPDAGIVLLTAHAPEDLPGGGEGVLGLLDKTAGLDGLVERVNALVAGRRS